LRSSIREFFFAEEVPYTLALLRITLPMVLLVPVLQRWPYIRELYSTDGSPSPLWINFGSPNLLPIPSATIAVALYAFMIFGFVTTMLGWFTRASLIAVTILYTYFTLLDSMTTMTKYTVIASHVLMLLAFSGCGAVWSFDAWMRASKTSGWSALPQRPLAPVWPRRLIAILLGVVYLGSAATKMHTPGYFSGDQLAYWMLTNMNLANPLGERLSLYPASLVVSAYVVILWEISFLLVCWRGWGRTLSIGLGYLFHIMTGLLLGLFIFPLLYAVLYLSLFGERDIQILGKKLRYWGRRHSWLAWTAWTPRWITRFRPQWPLGQSLAVYSGAAAVAMLVNMEVEYRRDVYGERRPEGRYALAPIDPQILSQRLHEAPGLDPADKMFAFDIGTELLGEVLMDRRKEYRQGEQAVIQCSLQPAHEDLFVEVTLRDATNRILKRNGVVVPRESLRGNVYYSLDGSLEPGDYAFVLRIDGKEIARKSFQLNPEA